MQSLLPLRSDPYTWSSGTSQAAPVVAGGPRLRFSGCAIAWEAPECRARESPLVNSTSYVTGRNGRP